MDPISADALTVLRALLERDHGEDDLPPGASIAMLQYLVALGYAACQTWVPPHPDSPYRDLAQGYVAYAITEKGREYIRLKNEAIEQERNHKRDQERDKRRNNALLIITDLLTLLISTLLQHVLG